jgi:Holliday junction DNA helicase RuvA
MIGKLNGDIENIYDDHILVNVNGICYIVFCSAKLLNNLSLGKHISIFIHTIQKDEMPILYGFLDYQDKEMFILLTSIQGVGGRMGIAIIGEIDHLMLLAAIKEDNPKILQQVSGIGAKIATRIINELKSNKKLFNGYISSIDNQCNIKNDAISALVNLGFKKVDVIRVVESYLKDNLSLDLESIIRHCITPLKKR